MARLPWGKRHQVVDFEVFRRAALFTSAIGSAQSYAYSRVPPEWLYHLLKVPGRTLIRAVFTPAFWERPRTVEAGLQGRVTRPTV